MAQAASIKERCRENIRFMHLTTFLAMILPWLIGLAGKWDSRG